MWLQHTPKSTATPPTPTANSPRMTKTNARKKQKIAWNHKIFPKIGRSNALFDWNAEFTFTAASFYGRKLVWSMAMNVAIAADGSQRYIYLWLGQFFYYVSNKREPTDDFYEPFITELEQIAATFLNLQLRASHKGRKCWIWWIVSSSPILWAQLNFTASSEQKKNWQTISFQFCCCYVCLYFISRYIWFAARWPWIDSRKFLLGQTRHTLSSLAIYRN